MRWTVFLVMLGCCLLQGCATEAGYQQILNSWVGAQEQRLVSQWGPPQGFYENGGVRYLTYDEASSAYVPGTPPTYQTTYIGNTAYSNPVGGSPGYMINRSCRTTFEVRDSTVINWRYQGNNCVAYPPK